MIGAGSIGTATVAGLALTGSAAAEISYAEFTGTSISETTDDGTLEDVRAGAENIGFEYDGLDDPATEATVKLQVVVGDSVKTIDSASRNDIAGTSDQYALGEDLSGSVLEHDNLDASDFEATTDGAKTTKNVTLRLEVTVTTQGGNSVTAESNANLAVVMNNRENHSDVGGNATGEIVADFETIGVSPANHSDSGAGDAAEGAMTLLAAYGPDEYRFKVELDDPWANPEKDKANFGIGFDTDLSTDTYQYQLNWSSSDGFFSHYDATTKYGSLPAGVTADRTETDDGAVFTFTIDREDFNYAGLPQDGEDYGIVANASYGGSTHVNISDDGENAWGGEDENGDFQWDRSDHFLTTTVNVQE